MRHEIWDVLAVAKKPIDPDVQRAVRYIKEKRLKDAEEINRMLAEYRIDQDKLEVKAKKKRLALAKTEPVLELPKFEYGKEQPDPAGTSRTIAVYNDAVSGLKFTVKRDRKGTTWFVSASGDGFAGKNSRCSNTLRTKVKTKGEYWIRAVEAGRVKVAKLT